jgi:hypothetical protein
MARRFALDPALQWDERLAYHQDIEASLRLYFSTSAPAFKARFVGKTQDEVDQELALRLEETDVRLAFVVLTSIKATFRVDFDTRCREKLKDDLSRYFRAIGKERKSAVRLDEDILEGGKDRRQ